MTLMWLREIRGGVALAARRWPATVGVAGVVAVMCVMLALTLSDVWAQVGLLRSSAVLRDQNATVFSSSYPPGGVIAPISDAVIADVANLIDEREAYTAVINNGFLDNPQMYDDPPLILIGGSAPDLFPELALCDPAPCAMKGADRTDDPGSSVRVAGRRIPLTSTLPPGASFFDPYAGAQKLDQRLVVRLSATDIPRLIPEAREEAMTRLVLLDPASRTTDAIVAGNARKGLFLVPHSLTEQQTTAYRNSLTTAVMYAAAALAFLFLVFVAFAASATDAVDRESRSFAIRRLYGASNAAVAARISGFLAAGMLIAPLMLLAALALVAGAFAAHAAIWIGVVLVVVFVVLVFRVTLRVTTRPIGDLV